MPQTAMLPPAVTTRPGTLIRLVALIALTAFGIAVSVAVCVAALLTITGGI